VVPQRPTNTYFLFLLIGSSFRSQLHPTLAVLLIDPTFPSSILFRRKRTPFSPQNPFPIIKALDGRRARESFASITNRYDSEW
jgi:hypothetical protein